MLRKEEELCSPSVGMDGAGPAAAAVNPKKGALPVLAGAAEEPAAPAPAKLKPLNAPVAGVPATAAGATAAALAAPDPKEKPVGFDGAEVAACN